MEGFCPLASGSRGNSVYLGTKEAKVLIDAGISGKQIESRLEKIGVSLSAIDAIVVTHEHSDHIQGLKVLAGKLGIPVFCNAETARGIHRTLLLPIKCKIFTTNEPFAFKDILFYPFSIQHDTLDPVGLVIHAQGNKIGLCTDLGCVTSLVQQNLLHCDYFYVEANHQPSLVHASLRPSVNKQRVLGRQGHLSNEECASLLSCVFHPSQTKAVYLAHLSQECNSPELALRIIQEKVKQTFPQSCAQFFIARQEDISTPVFF